MPVVLDRDAAAVYKAFQEAGRPAYETLTPPEARDYYLAARFVSNPEPPALESVDVLEIPAPHGAIPARLYRPKNRRETDGLAPCLVFFHGGGWVIGNLDSHDVVCRSENIDSTGTSVSRPAPGQQSGLRGCRARRMADQPIGLVDRPGWRCRMLAHVRLSRINGTTGPTWSNRSSTHHILKTHRSRRRKFRLIRARIPARNRCQRRPRLVMALNSSSNFKRTR